MGTLILLLFGALVALYVNVAASAAYAAEVMDAGTAGVAIGLVFMVVEFLIPIANRDEKFKAALLGRVEPVETLRGVVVPVLLEALLLAARAADVFTTTAALAGWDPALSPGQNLARMFGPGGLALVEAVVTILAGAFYAIAPELALLTLFDEGLALVGLRQAGVGWGFLAGLMDGISQIPLRARLVALGQKRPSRPRPGPVSVLAVALGIPVVAVLEVFNLYTTTVAARQILEPFGGDLGFLGLAALITGFQSVLWSSERDRGPLGWMVVSLAVDYSTALWFFLRQWPSDPAAAVMAIIAAGFVIAPEPLLTALLNAASTWTRAQVTAGVGSLGDYLGVFIAAARAAAEAAGESAKEAAREPRRSATAAPARADEAVASEGSNRDWFLKQ